MTAVDVDEYVIPLRDPAALRLPPFLDELPWDTAAGFVFHHARTAYPPGYALAPRLGNASLFATFHSLRCGLTSPSRVQRPSVRPPFEVQRQLQLFRAQQVRRPPPPRPLHDGPRPQSLSVTLCHPYCSGPSWLSLRPPYKRDYVAPEEGRLFHLRRYPTGLPPDAEPANLTLLAAAVPRLDAALRDRAHRHRLPLATASTQAHVLRAVTKSSLPSPPRPPSNRNGP